MPYVRNERTYVQLLTFSNYPTVGYRAQGGAQEFASLRCDLASGPPLRAAIHNQPNHKGSQEMPMSRDERSRRRRSRADTRLEQQRQEREQPSIDWDRAIARLRVMLDGRS